MITPLSFCGECFGREELQELPVAGDSTRVLVRCRRCREEYSAHLADVHAQAAAAAEYHEDKVGHVDECIHCTHRYEKGGMTMAQVIARCPTLHPRQETRR